MTPSLLPSLLQSSVMSVGFAQFHPNLIVGGTYSGQIVLWDNRSHRRTPVQRSPLSSAAHTVSTSFSLPWNDGYSKLIYDRYRIGYYAGRNVKSRKVKNNGIALMPYAFHSTLCTVSTWSELRTPTTWSPCQRTERCVPGVWTCSLNLRSVLCRSVSYYTYNWTVDANSVCVLYWTGEYRADVQQV